MKTKTREKYHINKEREREGGGGGGEYNPKRQLKFQRVINKATNQQIKQLSNNKEAPTNQQQKQKNN